jgi:hypothetical protein
MAHVRTLLASGPGSPEGDTGLGLDLRVCLTPLAQIDPVAFAADPLPWPVRRFWPDRADWRGEVIRVDDGWAVRSVGGDDEPLWELAAGVVRPGEYLTLRRPDGEELVFRVVGVDAE